MKSVIRLIITLCALASTTVYSDILDFSLLGRTTDNVDIGNHVEVDGFTFRSSTPIYASLYSQPRSLLTLGTNNYPSGTPVGAETLLTVSHDDEEILITQSNYQIFDLLSLTIGVIDTTKVTDIVVKGWTVDGSVVSFTKTLPTTGGLLVSGSDLTGFEELTFVSIQTRQKIYLGNVEVTRLPQTVLNQDNGTLKWFYAINEVPDNWQNSRQPAIANDGTIYFTTSHFDDNDNFYAVNPDGTLKWSLLDISTDAQNSMSSPSIDEIHQSVYVSIYSMGYTSYVSKVIAVGFDGVVRWEYVITTGDDNASYSRIEAPSIGSDGTLYLSTREGKVYAINTDGTLKWQIQTQGMEPMKPLITADGYIHVASDAGTVTTLDINGNIIAVLYSQFTLGAPAILNNGKLISSININSFIYDPWGKEDYIVIGDISGPFVSSNDGSIFSCDLFQGLNVYDNRGIGSTIDSGCIDSSILGSDGNLYNFGGANTRTGAPLWKKKFSAHEQGVMSRGDAASVKDRAMYMVTSKGLFAINADFPGVESSAWPMSQHDFQRTGRTTQNSAYKNSSGNSGGGGAVSLYALLMILLVAILRRLSYKYCFIQRTGQKLI